MLENNVSNLRRSISRQCKDTAIARIHMPLIPSVSPEKIKFKRPRSVALKKPVKDKDESFEMNLSSDNCSDSEYDSSISESSDESISSYEFQNVKNTKKPVQRQKTFNCVRKTFSVPPRKGSLITNDDIINLREKLHVSSVPEKLPCRENEFDTIYNMLKDKISVNTGGCLFISGLPGTGKTATMTSVLSHLQNEHEISIVELNGMHITKCKQLYAMVYQQLTGYKISEKQSQEGLKKILFGNSAKRKTTLLVIDELDQLYRKRQDMLYILFDWANMKASRLLIVGVANTMDLPERLFKNMISSRIGLSRVTFETYTYRQLIEIIRMRIGDQISKFDIQSIEFVAKKVATSSGDARRALDICRRALDMKKDNDKITISIISDVIKLMFTSPKFYALRNCCSVYEKLFLQAIIVSFQNRGLEDSSLSDVISQLTKICLIEGYKVPSHCQIYSILRSLSGHKLILCESLSNSLDTKLKLNCSPNDVKFAFENN